MIALLYQSQNQHISRDLGLKKNLSGSLKVMIKRIFNADDVHSGKTIKTATFSFNFKKIQLPNTSKTPCARF